MDSLQNTTWRDLFSVSSVNDKLPISDEFVRAVDWLSFYYSLLLIVTGCVSNPLSFVVLSRKAFRASATSIYLRLLSVVDLGAILAGLLRFFIKKVFFFDVRGGGLSCQIFYYFSGVSLQCSSWTMVVVTSERMISITQPHRVQVWCSRTTAIIVTCLLLAVQGTVSLMYPLLAESPQVFDTTLNETITLPCGIEYNTQASVHIVTLFASTYFAFIPSFIIIIFNVIIVHAVIASRKRVSKFGDKSKKPSVTEHRWQRVASINSEAGRQPETVGNITTSSPSAKLNEVRKEETTGVNSVNVLTYYVQEQQKYARSLKPASGVMPDVTIMQNTSISQSLHLTEVDVLPDSHRKEQKLHKKGESQNESSPSCNSAGIKASRVSNPKGEKPHHRGVSSRETSLTVTLLVVSTAFVLCTFPNSAFGQYRHLFLQENRQLGPVLLAVANLLDMLTYTNNAINFLLYCLTGSRFRSEVRAVLAMIFTQNVNTVKGNTSHRNHGQSFKT